jgi:hypothetical protein
MKEAVACLALSLCILPASFAAGTKEGDFRQTEGTVNWQYNYDISGLAPGKYNLLIEAKDKAGNTSTAGPYNVYVDPKSDLPVASISNPTPGLRVGGDLNIVGTCVDDDGVDHVEVRIDDGEFLTAEGKDFWSSTLDVSSIPNGRHKVTARGVDINGVTGDPVSVSFDLDTIKPFIKMTSHESGTLASGTVTFSGTVEDANGVRSLVYSTDNRKTYINQDIQQSGDKTSARFNLSVDTKRLKDGPYVYWFKGTDMTKSVGYLAFLFFVDNTGPALDILQPKPDEKVSGKVTVSGKITEQIGIKSFSFDAGNKDAGTIDLVPGNPYWIHEFDFSKIQGTSAQITFTMVDLAGNRTTKQVTIQLLDEEVKRPVLTLRSPVSAGSYPGDILLSGSLRDDEGVKGLQYVVDSNKPVILDSKETFETYIPALAPGKHKLTIHGIDVSNRAGKDLVVEFVSTGQPPVVSLDGVTNKKGTVPFRAGHEISRYEGSALTGKILTPAKLAVTEYSFNGAAAEKLSTKGSNKPGETDFDIPVPPAISFGIVTLSIRVTDEFKQLTEYKSLFHVANYTRRNVEPGIYFSDARIQSDGTVALKGDAPLTGIFAEEEIGTVTIEPSTDLVSVSSEGDRIIISPQKGGISGPVHVKVVSAKKHVFTSPDFKFITDGEKPVITITKPQLSDWLSRQLTVTGNASDGTGIKTLEYSLDGMKSFSPVDVPASSKGIDFNFNVPLDSQTDGPVDLAMRCTDAADNSSVAHVVFLKDATEPTINILTPKDGDSLSGKFPVTGLVTDGGVVTKIELSTDGQTFSPLDGTGVFSTIIDPSGMPKPPQQITIRATDRSGNSATATVSISLTGETPSAASGQKDTEKPALLLFYPLKDARLHGKVTFIGRVSDNQERKRLSYDAGGTRKGDIELFPGTPYWILQIDYTGEKGSGQSISFTAEDLSANKTDLRYSFTIDPVTDQPVVSVVQPQNKAIVEGSVFLWGSAKDDDGIGKVLYAIDAGAESELPGGGAFGVGLDNLAAGQHKLTVRAEDSNGIAGAKVEVAFSVIGSSPVIRADKIAQGKDSQPYSDGMLASIDKSTVFSGTAVIPNSLKSAEYSLQGGQARKFDMKKAEKSVEYGFDIPLPPELPYGRIDLRITVTDAQDRKAEYSTSFYRGEKDPGGINDGEGISFIDSRIDANGAILLAPGETVAGYFNGRPIKEAKISPESGVISAAFEGNFILVSAVKDGLLSGTRIQITTVDGDAFQSDPYSFLVDTDKPVLTVTSPQTGDWLSKSIALKGAASDANGIRKLEYAFNLSDTYLPIQTTKTADGGFAFDVPVDMADVPEGDVGLTVRADDGAGRQSAVTYWFMKDSQEPEISMITPPADDPINGLITLTGTAKEDGIVDLVEFSSDGKTFTPISGTKVFSTPLDLTKYNPLPEKFFFRATDRSGNTAVFSPTLDVQQAMDIPTVQIQTPEDGEVLRNDFVISGMAFDDDGIGAIFYSVDGGDYTKLPGANSFSVAVTLQQITDNEHAIEVKTEDLNGVPSEVRKSTFKISKAEPTSKLLAPALSKTVRGTIDLEGESADKNGIGEVFISFDNGQTFNLAEGKEKWKYRLDTRILKDGTYAIMVKAVDGYGTDGLYATLANIDNAPPMINLDSPPDGVTITESLTFDGRAIDNIELTSLKASVQPLGVASAQPAVFELPKKGIFSYQVDLKSFPSGWYDISLEAVDKAENVTKVSRNILIQEKKSVERADIWFPVNGENLHGTFTVSGRVESTSSIPEVGLTMDGQPAGTIPVNANGYFSTTITPELIQEGAHSLAVQAQIPNGPQLLSGARTITYGKLGPWIRIESHALGDFVTSRPFIKGEAGWVAEEVDAADKEAVSRANQEREAHRVQRVEISLDNGKTFMDAQGNEKWQYRLETQNYSDGDIRFMTRATFADGSTALDQTILVLDDTPPQVVLLSPREEGSFNAQIAMMGTAHDENGVIDVRAAVRKGDKSNYEVPAFIQGLYFEGHALGVTWGDFGVGLTFFNNVVKLQAQVGAYLDGDARFSGLFLGAKLLSNIANFPFSFIGGPDWDFLSASLALGANFTYVTQSGAKVEFTDKGLILAAVIAQLEFPIIKIKSWSMFNTYSLYTEYQLWFISSDVSAGVENKLSFGLRVGLF